MSQYQNRINYCNSLQNYVLVSWYSGVDAMPSLLLFLKYRLPYGMAVEDVNWPLDLLYLRSDILTSKEPSFWSLTI